MKNSAIFFVMVSYNNMSPNDIPVLIMPSEVNLEGELKQKTSFRAEINNYIMVNFMNLSYLLIK